MIRNTLGSLWAKLGTLKWPEIAQMHILPLELDQTHIISLEYGLERECR